MAQKIIFVSHPYQCAQIQGNSFVVNDGGVMKQFPIHGANPSMMSDQPDNFDAAADQLDCATAFPVEITLTINGQPTVIETAMCLKIYTGLIAISASPPVNRGQTTVLQNATNAAQNLVKGLRSCCS